MTVPRLTTALTGPLPELESHILKATTDIEHWLRLQWQDHAAPFYASVDLRNAGFKLAPVDTNLFPGGFNNLNPDFHPLCVQAAMAAIEKACPDARAIALVPENHTRNQFYLQNVEKLARILRHAGVEVRIGSLLPEITAATDIELTNGTTLRRQLVKDGSIFQSTTDTEVVLHLISRSQKRRIVERLVEALRQLEGSYAFVCVTNDMLIGARDPVGIRPLVIGRLGDAWVLASETCALDIVGAQFVREVENGEVVTITQEGGLESHRPFPMRPARPCIFEYIYFARPDSVVGGRSVYEIRKRMGAELARETPCNADVIVPIPDSGVPAAIGYAQISGVPFELGIIRNQYVGRTFIEPEQKIRALGVKLKHSANQAVVRDRRIVLIDDSIVRGTTSKKIVAMMYEAGAREVHMRIACPEIKYGDYYGIDTPDRKQLISANMNAEEIRREIGATSLAFLTVDGLYRAMGSERRDPLSPQFSDHCFTGDYPTDLTDLNGGGTGAQLSLLTEVG